MALDWCFLGIRSSRNPSSGTPADHGGAAPSQAAQLLLLHCFTAGVGGRNLVGIFFFLIIFNRPTHSILYRFLKAVRGRRVRKESKL